MSGVSFEITEKKPTLRYLVSWNESHNFSFY